MPDTKEDAKPIERWTQHGESLYCNADGFLVFYRAHEAALAAAERAATVAGIVRIYNVVVCRLDEPGMGSNQWYMDLKREIRALLDAAREGAPDAS